MAARFSGTGPGASGFLLMGRIIGPVPVAFTTLAGLLGCGPGVNRNRCEPVGYQRRFQRRSRCRSQLKDRPLRFRCGVIPQVPPLSSIRLARRFRDELAGRSASGDLHRRPPGPRWIRLAFAAGRVRLALCPGSHPGERYDIPQAGPQVMRSSFERSGRDAFAVPVRLRSSLQGAEASCPYHRACRSGSLRSRSEQAAPHLGGNIPLQVGTAPRCPPSRAASEQETLRASPAGSFPVPGLRPAPPFGIAVRSLPQPFSRPSPSARSGLSQQPNVSVRVASR
jgi:hypothetical protein